MPSIDKQQGLRRDCICNIEIVLKIWRSGVQLHSTKNVFDTHTHVPVRPFHVTRSATAF